MQIFKRHQAIWRLLTWKKRAPTRPVITKGNLVKSSCDSEYKLPVEKCRNLLRTNRFSLLLLLLWKCAKWTTAHPSTYKKDMIDKLFFAVFVSHKCEIFFFDAEKKSTIDIKDAAGFSSLCSHGRASRRNRLWARRDCHRGSRCG